MKRLDKYHALQKVHTALDDATMATGMSERDINVLTMIMRDVRTMMNATPQRVTTLRLGERTRIIPIPANKGDHSA